ncbi:MAG: hypothetical protein WD270_06780 [Acetobacterales bacterium]
MTSHRLNMEEALRDPQRAYGSPWNVVSDPRIDRTTKIVLLTRWLEAARMPHPAQNGAADADEQLSEHIREAIRGLKQSGC